MGLPSASPWCLWAPRWQLCGQLNGSSVPLLAPHPTPGSPNPPALGWGAQGAAHGVASQKQQQKCLLGNQAGQALALAQRTRVIGQACFLRSFWVTQEAKLLSGGSCPCRLLTPLSSHCLFCVWALYRTLTCSLLYTTSTTEPGTQWVLSAHYLEAQQASFSPYP